ncbi:MAG: hypothetical protein PHR35_09710 [Kiritimatiellae bacterium]|nr:hypothetical protein [Kiritimatiellia bacterium]
MVQTEPDGLGGAILRLSACRFGGDGGGIPLVKSQDGQSRLVFSGVHHESSLHPRYIFEAAPAELVESGMSGAATGTGIYMSPDALKAGLANAIMRKSVSMSDARFLVLDDMSRSKAAGTIGMVNYNVSRAPHVVFDTVKLGADLRARKVSAGFEGLKGQRYEVKAKPAQFKDRYYTVGPRLTAGLSFQALTNRIYNLTFFYRSRSLKELKFVCKNGAETSRAAGLPDTGGRLAQGTTSLYVGLPGSHDLDCAAEFSAADGFLEIYPIAITDGPFNTPYLSGPQWDGSKEERTRASSDQIYYSQHQTTLHFMGTAAPTNGTWRRGSVIYNNDPEPGKPFGWVCIEEGTPGEWCPVGQIGN